MKQKSFEVGRVYRVAFPGVAARIIEPPKELMPPGFPFLAQSLVTAARWHVAEDGSGRHLGAPRLLADKDITRGVRWIKRLLLLVIAIYVPAIIWLTHAYPPSTAVLIKLHTFQKSDGFAYESPFDPAQFGKSERLEVYENKNSLGPADAAPSDISSLGQGRYLLKDKGQLIFSTSDNSDPRSNGRYYFIFSPGAVEPPAH